MGGRLGGLALAGLLALGCADGGAAWDGSGADGRPDAAERRDGGSDGGGARDAGGVDARVPDGGVPDGAVPDGAVPDGAVPDGGEHAPDGGVPDGGSPDGGVPDGGVPDGGATPPTPPTVPTLSHPALGAVEPIGFDPGLETRRATRLWPDRAHYFESCPDGPGGRCQPTLPAGHGFYTIIAGQGTGTDQECTVNSFAPYDATPTNPGVPCPYSFFWGVEPAVGAFARMGVDARAFVHPSTNNLGWGMITQIPLGAAYLGSELAVPDWTPRLGDVGFVDVTYRARLCPARDGEATIATAYQYFILVDPATGEGWTFVLHPFEFVRGASDPPVPTPAEPIQDEVDLGGTPGTVDARNIHVHGPSFGLTPAGLGWTVDASCTQPTETLPWQSYRVDVQRLVDVLADAGRIDPAEVRELRMIGEILFGGEVFGRSTIEVDLGDHALWGRRAAAQAGAGCAGSARPQIGAIEGGLWCAPAPGTPTGFAWASVEGVAERMQCNAGGGGAGRVDPETGLTCRPFDGGPTGWAWLP